MQKYGVVVGVLFILFCGFAFGDGCYIPSRVMKSMPEIPSQRAVIVYRDGVETLVIESALEGEGKDFGWVIPLPSRPDEFSVTSSGFIKTLSLSIQPDIIHDNYYIIPVVALVWVTLAWFLTVKSNRDNVSRALSFIQFLLLFLVAVLMLGIFMPSLGSVGHRLVKGVEIVNNEEVGSYGLTVLEADDAGSVDEWLTANGFLGLNEKGLAIVDGYIVDGWCFVAAKLKRDGDGYCVPHPLSMKFKSERAVYPMKLTAMAESDVYLELFVVGQSGFKADGLELEFCDTYKSKTKAGRDSFSGKDLSGFAGSDRWSRIGHPEAFNFMWDGCVLSKLTGTFGPDEMDEDIILEEFEGDYIRKRYYSYQGAIAAGSYCGLILWSILIIAITLIKLNKIKYEWGWMQAFQLVILRSFIAGVVLALVIFLSLEKVRTGGEYYHSGIAHNLLRGQLLMTHLAIEYHFDQPVEVSIGDLEELLGKDLSDFELENYINGGKIKLEDSPGNLTVFEDERGVVVRGYLVGGFPADMVISEVFEK